MTVDAPEGAGKLLGHVTLECSTELLERAYIAGGEAVARTMLGHVLGELRSSGDPPPPEVELHRWRLERHDAIAAARDICTRLGLDSDWPDDLHLADVIRRIVKHLGHEA